MNIGILLPQLISHYVNLASGVHRCLIIDLLMMMSSLHDIRTRIDPNIKTYKFDYDENRGVTLEFGRK